MICNTNKDKRLFEVAEGTLTKLKKYYIKPNDPVEINYNDGKKKLSYIDPFLKKASRFFGLNVILFARTVTGVQDRKSFC